MPATPRDLVRFGFIVEGHGEVDAIPLLVRRICNELLGVFSLATTKPVRITKSQLLREHELERAVQLVRMRTDGPVLVMLDADKDCPAMLGASLKSRATAILEARNVSVVIPKYEFETWFLASAESLGGKRRLSKGLIPPSDPETIQGAKEWLSRHMAANHKYSESVDQAALVAYMDLGSARTCKSFDRLCREIKRVVESR